MEEFTNWEIKQTDLTQDDPLLQCLVLLTQIFFKPCTAESLTAGLPLEQNKLTPELFPRAAKRADLSAKLVKRELSEIPKALMPTVLLLKNNRACVLKEINEDVAEIIYPETGSGVDKVKLEDLLELYTGFVILIRPRYHFDVRTDETIKERPQRWFWGIITRAWPVYSEIFVASFLINLFALATPLFIMNVYNRVIPNNAIETLWVLAIGVAIVFGFEFLMRLLRVYFIDMTAKRIDVQLSSSTFEQILGLRMAERPGSVGVLANMIQAFESFRDFITSASVSILVDIPFAILFITIIWLVAGPLAWVPLITIPLILLVSVLIQPSLNQLVQQSYRHAAEKQATLLEGLANAETVKTLRAEGLIQRRWENVIIKAAALGVKLRTLSGFSQNFALFMQHLTTVFVVIFGVYEITAGRVSLGGLIAAVILTSRAMAPIIQLAGLMARYQQSKLAIDGLDKIMHLPTDRPQGKPILQRARFKGSIAFKEVNISYPGQKVYALHNVSFHIRAGEHVGILGGIGSGKSTILKLILKLYQPNEGSIMVDDIELEQIDAAEIRYHIGYVPQDVFLLHGTIRENIVMGAPYADDSVVLRAAELAGVTNFVNLHPEGFDRQVGEGGQSLSSGQRRSIAIARALILDPPILLFDEPSANLDDHSVAQFINHISGRLENKTLVLVTHKVPLLTLVDRLIVVHQGRIIADGPKEIILKRLAERVAEHQRKHPKPQAVQEPEVPKPIKATRTTKQKPSTQGEHDA